MRPRCVAHRQGAHTIGARGGTRLKTIWRVFFSGCPWCAPAVVESSGCTPFALRGRSESVSQASTIAWIGRSVPPASVLSIFLFATGSRAVRYESFNDRDKNPSIVTGRNSDRRQPMEFNRGSSWSRFPRSIRRITRGIDRGPEYSGPRYRDSARIFVRFFPDLGKMLSRDLLTFATMVSSLTVVVGASVDLDSGDYELFAENEGKSDDNGNVSF